MNRPVLFLTLSYYLITFKKLQMRREKTSDMPSSPWRDIFANAKEILCRWHSDIIFAVYTREANITRQRRISLPKAISLAARRI